jgi:oxygen-independent coproporphyrinogen-3 oxidase
VEQQVIFNPDLIQRYDKTGPRYTSYPTAVQFHEGFGEAQYRIRARAANDEAKPRPLSLYFHIPFCATVCYYCACNKIVTKNRAHAVAYVDHLRREVELQAQLFGRERAVEQLHWGGGTPTFLNQGQMRALMRTTARHFNLLDGDRGEYSIEIDPRTVNEQTMVLLREFGFNRMSLGVQDPASRFQIDQCRSHLRSSPANGRQLFPHARQNYSRQPRPAVRFQLRAPAAALQGAAPNQRGRSAHTRRKTQDPAVDC